MGSSRGVVTKLGRLIVARSAASGTLMARKPWTTALQHCKSYGDCERIGDDNEETTFPAN
jgi:hypothetical protein